MKYKNGDVVFESTGRIEYTFGYGFTPNDEGSILYGSDGGIDNLSTLERKEVAEYMINIWKRWAEGEDVWSELE